MSRVDPNGLKVESVVVFATDGLAGQRMIEWEK